MAGDENSADVTNKQKRQRITLVTLKDIALLSKPYWKKQSKKASEWRTTLQVDDNIKRKTKISLSQCTTIATSNRGWKIHCPANDIIDVQMTSGRQKNVSDPCSTSCCKLTNLKVVVSMLLKSTTKL